MKRLYEERKDAYNGFGAFRSTFLSLVRGDGALDFYHGGLRARDQRGATIFDQSITRTTGTTSSRRLSPGRT